jgi:hypothetical protein
MAITFKLRKQDVALGLRLRHGHSRLKATHHRYHVPPGANVFHYGGSEKVHLRTRRENSAEIECGGKHADYRYNVMVEANGLTDNRRVRAKLALPEGIAQEDGWTSAFNRLVGSEQPPQCGLDAQSLKKITRHPHERNRFRLAPTDQFGFGEGVIRYESGQLLKGSVAALVASYAST